MVVNGSGKKGLRSFEIVNVVNERGCETKFNKKSRLVGRNPAGSAKRHLMDYVVLRTLKVSVPLMFIFAKLHKDQNTKNTCISVSASYSLNL